eukprot:scaffold5866_cov49-Attheya_sp.AAC.6
MGSSSLLLQRIQTFLPQIQAANQGLEKTVDGETNPSAYQIDANFALDDDDSDNDNDGVEKDDDKDGKAPIIQLRVALGEFDDDENILGTQTTTAKTDEKDGKDDDESAN